MNSIIIHPETKISFSIFEENGINLLKEYIKMYYKLKGGYSILSKINNRPPIKLAEILRKHLLSNFKEFKSIDIANPGFINITFKQVSFMRF